MLGHTPHEKTVREKLIAEGWTVLRNGWPDWACFKTDETGNVIAVRFVEAKADEGKVSPLQEQMFKVLAFLGCPVEVISDPTFYKTFDWQAEAEHRPERAYII